MSRNRYARRTDDNQKDIVKKLRKIESLSIELDKDDILIGYEGQTFWYEIKTPESVSKKTGEINESAKKDGQKDLEKTWKGHYKIVSSVEEILIDMKYGSNDRIADALTKVIIED